MLCNLRKQYVHLLSVILAHEASGLGLPCCGTCRGCAASSGYESASACLSAYKHIHLLGRGVFKDRQWSRPPPPTPKEILTKDGGEQDSDLYKAIFVFAHVNFVILIWDWILNTKVRSESLPN